MREAPVPNTSDNLCSPSLSAMTDVTDPTLAPNHSIENLGDELDNLNGTSSDPIQDSIAEMADDGWEVLPFPNALNLDELPVGTASPTIEPVPEGVEAALPDSAQALQDENAELRELVAQLESALSQSQETLREEIGRWELLALAQVPEDTVNQTALIERHNQELAAAQERVKQLFQELQRSHRTAQRQQILVETLNDQLQSSQEQIAQLERECALTQQRYTEQVQLLHQSENTCRDLRSRLHRQQRYTLQFKAALEKCLDMPTPVAQPITSSFTAEVPSSVEPLNLAPKVHIPRSQPVQPWSAPTPEEKSDANFQTWLNTFLQPDPSEDGVEHGETIADFETGSETDPEVTGELVFAYGSGTGLSLEPTEAKRPEILLFESPQSEPSRLEISQPEISQPEISQPEASQSEPQMPPIAQGEDTLSGIESSSWENAIGQRVSSETYSTEKLGESVRVGHSLEESPLGGVTPVNPPTPSASDQDALPIAEDGAEEDSVNAVSQAIVKPSIVHLASPLESWITPQADMNQSQTQAHELEPDEFQSDELQPAPNPDLVSEVDQPSDEDLDPEASSEGAGISPVLYPSRHRKRDSLAAVELPSFPRRS
jgi:hypothetical protein